LGVVEQVWREMRFDNSLKNQKVDVRNLLKDDADHRLKVDVEHLWIYDGGYQPMCDEGYQWRDEGEFRMKLPSGSESD
jgi:hypothetical protein